MQQPAVEASDEAIVGLIQAGSTAAFALMMRRHSRYLLHVAWAMLHDLSEAEEAVQDAFLDAYQAIKEFRGEASLKTWLTRLTANRCLARMRKHTRRDGLAHMESVDEYEEELSYPADESETPYQSLHRVQILAIIQDKINELPEIFRTVFIMRSVEEYSVEETAQVLGLNEDTVKTRHLRARKLLKDALQTIQVNVKYLAG